MADPHGTPDPSPWVVRARGLVRSGGRVLDLACGQGRHVRFFAERGHPVLAVDRDPAALAPLAAIAGVQTLLADLEGAPWPLGGQQFDAIVVTNYLHRPLFGPIADALAPGGVLIYETFMHGNEAYGKPSNPAFLLAPGELPAVFGARLATLAFEQGRIARPKAAVVQRLIALHGRAQTALID